ncbi:MAG: VWA domain-containing protein [Bryobacteraceae bacterium]|nr:VWA domain-containing protein [Bryobacteraceae bacterium]
MMFEHGWALFFLLPLLAWALWQWRTVSRRAGLILKVLSIAALIVALAEPRMPVWETKVGVTILADTSASVSGEDLGRASEIVSGIEAARGRHWVRVIPFARDTRPPSPGEHSSPWKFGHTDGPDGRGTNLESALRDGIAALPAGLVPRVVLISDGMENRGSIARAAWQARQLGIPVDTYRLAGKPEPGLRLESVSLPAVAFTGERFPIDIAVRAARAAEGVVEIRAESKSLGSAPVRLAPGLNNVRVHASLNESGAFDISGAIRTADLGEAQFAQAVTLRRPRALYVSPDPPAADANFLGLLKSAEFETAAFQDLPAALESYQLVILNNWDLKMMAAARKLQLEDFVKQGGGLLVIGGERNVHYLEEGKTEEDPLERAMPAKIAPPRSPEGTCVVLIIDKSSSMEGKKMQLARLAAIGVIDNLRPVDRVGVLIFDNSFQWAVPIRLAEDRNLIKRLVSGITPDGGTQIAPALAEAYRRVLPLKSTFKHIVLLTDGISEEGDSISLAQEAALQRVTISTVGLGQDVNKQYLEKVATLAKGRSYLLTDPAELERILIRDVLEHTGSTAVEKPIEPIVMKQAEVLDGVNMESAPPLKGYVRFESKPSAETILSVERKDPLFVRWQYGLGRAAVFTSDAKSRWAADWLPWRGFDRFWTNTLRDLLPRAHAGEAVVTFDSANGELIADYRLAPHVPEPARIPDVFILGPDGFRKPLPVRKVAAGVYQGRIPAGEREGLFRIRSLEENAAFPEIGFYRAEQELNEYGSNEALLRQVAEFTGGRWQPGFEDAFQTDGRAVAGTLRLWPALIALAILLNLAELAHRKWRGILEALSRSR